MKIVTFNAAARKRIARAVRQVETTLASPKPRRQRRGGVQQLVTFALADEDIEHGSFGDVKLAAGGSMDSTLYPKDDDLISVYNPLPLIWSGSRLIIERATLAGTTERVDAIKWIVRHAWSATRIRGTADANIAAGGNGTISSIVTLNGDYPHTSATVHLPTSYVAIDGGLAVWAELVYDPAGSRWEVYAADCTGGP